MQELKRIRNERGWSQRRLAKESGVNTATINQVEQGKRSPTIETLDKLTRALDVEIADLFPKAEPSLFEIVAPNPEQRRAISSEWNQGARDGEPVKGIWVALPPGPARDMILSKLQDASQHIEHDLQEIANDVEDDAITQRLNRVVAYVAEQIGGRDAVST